MYIDSVRASVDILPLCVPLCVLRCFAHWVCGCANCVRCFEKQNKAVKIVFKQSRKTVTALEHTVVVKNSVLITAQEHTVVAREAQACQGLP